MGFPAIFATPLFHNLALSPRWWARTANRSLGHGRPGFLVRQSIRRPDLLSGSRYCRRVSSISVLRIGPSFIPRRAKTPRDHSAPWGSVTRPLEFEAVASRPPGLPFRPRKTGPVTTATRLVVIPIASEIDWGGGDRRCAYRRGDRPLSTYFSRRRRCGRTNGAGFPLLLLFVPFDPGLEPVIHVLKINGCRCQKDVDGRIKARPCDFSVIPLSKPRPLCPAEITVSTGPVNL